MKKTISLFAAFVLLFALWVPAQAAQARLDYVTDAACLLTDEEWEVLENTARDISESYQCGVYIITLDDFTNYSSAGSIYEAAKDIYREYELGWGQEKSGVLLLLSMAERDYTLIAYGYGNTAFTDFGKDKLADVFLDNLADDDWYGGFTDYLHKCGSMLSSARAGRPLDVGSDPLVFLAGLGISLVLGCLISVVICSLLLGTMRSVAVKTEAGDYLRRDSVVFTRREDRFTHATESRVKIEKGSGGGGGTTVDSDGFSGESGKF